MKEKNVLSLEVVSSAINLEKGYQIKILMKGALNSERKEKDGISYFGCHQKDDKGKVINDVVIPYLSLSEEKDRNR